MEFSKALGQMMVSDFPIILSLIFGGCCSNAFALEVLVTDAPKSGELITLGQFLFVAAEGLRHHIIWGEYGPKLKKTVVPLTSWMFLVVMFFLVSLLNNMALGYNISVPLHIIFRSGGLITNMVMGAIILKKRYSLGQMLGVVLVTVGVIWATLDNASNYTQTSTANTSEFVIGISLLSIAMVLSAGMGLFQEVTYKKYGKEWREGLFYTHFLALPFFLFFSKDLHSQILDYNRSPYMSITSIFEQTPILGLIIDLMPNFIRDGLNQIQLRKLWAFLLMNVATQYGCIAGVNRMTSVSTSLTLNLVLNLRKFASLIISIIYFDNDFGLGAKIGTALVFVGTIVYSQSGIKSNSSTSNSSPSKKK
ncbi:UAA transporter [Sporodiniella umbellata]|nr:UAA transporter [Sporodiniella umbellata]